MYIQCVLSPIYFILIILLYFYIYLAFDANVVEVRREDVQEFLGALDDSLRKATPRHNSTTATTTAAAGGLA